MASVLVDSENQIWAITNWGNSGLFKLNKAENMVNDVKARNLSVEYLDANVTNPFIKLKK